MTFLLLLLCSGATWQCLREISPGGHFLWCLSPAQTMPTWPSSKLGLFRTPPPQSFAPELPSSAGWRLCAKTSHQAERVLDVSAALRDGTPTLSSVALMLLALAFIFSYLPFYILGLLGCRFWFLTSFYHLKLEIRWFGFQRVTRGQLLSPVSPAIWTCPVHVCTSPEFRLQGLKKDAVVGHCPSQPVRSICVLD